MSKLMYRFLDELLSEGFINLSKPSENTIEGLIADDEIRKANMSTYNTVLTTYA